MRQNSLHDELFGELVWDSEQHCWEGQGVSALGYAFGISIDTGSWDMRPPFDDTQVDRTIAQASRDAFSRIRNSEQHVRESLSVEYVPLFEKWHGEAIAPEVFQKRLELEDVLIFPDGSAQLYYGDDGMFFGHSLIAHLDSAGSFARGELFG